MKDDDVVLCVRNCSYCKDTFEVEKTRDMARVGKHISGQAEKTLQLWHQKQEEM